MSELEDLRAEVGRLRAACIPLTDLVQELELARQNLHHARAMSNAHFELKNRAEAELRHVREMAVERGQGTAAAPSSDTGWFADVGRADDAMPGMWQPCLDCDTGHIPCFDIWFDTKEQCEAYIRDTVLPIAGRMTS